MGSRSRSENHPVKHSVGNSESTRSSSTNHPKLVRGMDGLVVCAMPGACRGRGFEPRFVRPSRGTSVRPPPPPPSASRSTTGTAGATGGVSPPFFPTHPPPPHPPPGGQRHTHTHTKRSTRHSTPAAARSVTATAVRRVAHVLLILLSACPRKRTRTGVFRAAVSCAKAPPCCAKPDESLAPPSLQPSCLPLHECFPCMTEITHKKRGTKHGTPAAARPVTATGVRRAARFLLVVLLCLPAEEDSNSGFQGTSRLHGRCTTLRKPSPP